MGLNNFFQSRTTPGVPQVNTNPVPKSVGLSGMLSQAQPQQQSMAPVIRQTENMQTRIEAAGQGDKLDKPSQFNVMKLLEGLAAPGYAANNLIREFISPNEGATPGEFDPLKAYARGWKGEEKPSGGDMLREIGMENKKLASILGFAWDVINPLDLVNWVSFGVGKAVTTSGLKGTKALSRAFGDEAAEALVRVLGDSVDDIGAKSVGQLTKQVTDIAKNTGRASVDDVSKIMTDGMLKTHNNLTTKIPYNDFSKLTVQFETPIGLSRQKLGNPVEIPGSQMITRPVTAAKDAFLNTRAGDKLGKMFSTKYRPKNVPDSVLLRQIQEKGPNLAENVANLADDTIERGVRDIAPEIVDNSMEMGAEINKAVSRAVGFDEVEGARVYDEFVQGISEIFETAPRKSEDFQKQVDAMFSGISKEDRKLILDHVLDQNVPLPENLQPAADMFKKWREGLIKDYNDLGIPINELENYVPFIPTRSLKNEERAGLKALFGTADSKAFDPDADILDVIKKLDPNLRQRTTNAIDPREVNRALGEGAKPWLSEDPAHMMLVRGTRAVKTKEVAQFVNNFLDVYGLKVSDLAELKKMPKGYAFFENFTDATGAKVLKQVTDLNQENSSNVVAIPEEFAKVFNEYMELFYNKDSQNAVLRQFDKATGIWKKWAYLYNPGHIPRDLTGNVWQGYLLGIRNPKYYQHSTDAMKQVPKIMDDLQPLLDNAKALDETFDVSDIDNIINTYKQAVKDGVVNPVKINLKGKEVDVFEAFQKARRYGALETIAAMADTPRTIQQSLNIAKGKKLSKAVGDYESIMRKWTEDTNNWTRFAGYLHQLGEGKSFTGAAAQVKKFYFDYFDLTPFERKVMKRVMPFYTWTRKNIPMEVEALMKRPKDFAVVQKGIDAIEGEDRDQPLPDWAEDTGLIKMGDSGKYFNPNLPYQDLGRLPVNRDNIANLLASLNPLIRGPIEWTTNTEMYSGKPIERYANEEQTMPIIGTLMKLLGDETPPQVDKRGLGYLMNQLPMLRNIDTVMDPDNPRQRARLGTMLGIPSTFDAEQLERSKIYEDNNELNELIRLLRDRGIEIPTLDEINEDPREELLKRLGLR